MTSNNKSYYDHELEKAGLRATITELTDRLIDAGAVYDNSDTQARELRTAATEALRYLRTMQLDMVYDVPTVDIITLGSIIKILEDALSDDSEGGL